MSATINIHLFTEYFSGAPLICVPGRLYAIDMHYRPLGLADRPDKRSPRINPAPYIRILRKIELEYLAEQRGDVLCFVAGMSDIETICEAVAEHGRESGKWIALPLHSALSMEEQDRVFDIAPDGVRKCVVSTNIAETSVTIDGVRFVIDSGHVKEMTYDGTLKMQRLKEQWISKASAEQRKGRAGRTGPGVCFRLYEESDFDQMSEYSMSEIRRVPLEVRTASTVLVVFKSRWDCPVENYENTL